MREADNKEEDACYPEEWEDERYKSSKEKYFEYYEWGFVDSGVIYGYFYSPDNQCVSYGIKYRKGYRSEGSPNYGNGWVYFEQICDHWYYYEEHYG